MRSGWSRAAPSTAYTLPVPTCPTARRPTQLTVKSKGRFNLALDSLALYTNAGFKASMTVTLCMLALALAELVYTLVVFITGHPVEGWTTTMFVITVGFSGLFAVLTIVVKYLSLLVDLVFKQQKYLVESIEKLQK